MTEPVKPNQSEESIIVEVEPTPHEPASVSQQVEPVMAPPVVVKSGGKGLSIFALILAVLALGGTGYSFYKDEFLGRNEENRIALQITEIGGSITRMGDSITRLQSDQTKAVTQEQLKTRILESNSAVDLRLRDVNQGQTELFDAVAKINSDLSSGVNEYIVAEVSQLLKLANNSALFSSDTRSAIKALQLADLQLKELADPRYSIVRRNINQEIALLQSIEQLDIESVTVQLKSLANRIPSLNLENDVPALGEVVVEVDEKPTGFRAGLNEMWADIVNYNSVQRIDQAPKPLLLPDQRYFLNQNIQLQLAKAELAVLQNRAPSYQDSLEVATTWLNEYFDLRDQEVIEVLDQIEQLKTLSLSEELPSISGSYSELQKIKGGQ